jgi:hypothetical protein
VAFCKKFPNMSWGILVYFPGTSNPTISRKSSLPDTSDLIWRGPLEDQRARPR